MKFPKLATFATVLVAGALAMGASGCNTQKSDSGSGTSQTDSKPKTASSQEIYDKVQNGMTKEQVVQIAGKEPDNCTDSEIAGIGKTSLCSYGTVSLTLQNGQVTSKTKL